MAGSYWLKGCPKCGGDLYKKIDQFGRYVACLQCGRHMMPDRPAAVPAPPVELHRKRLREVPEEALV